MIPMAAAPAAAHCRRLREVWRSAGWPYQDIVEAELLAWGLLERRRDANGRDSVRVTDAGVQLIASTTQRHRDARGAHELLVERIAREMQRAGRIVWRGLGLRAPLDAPAGSSPAGSSPAGSSPAGSSPDSPDAKTTWAIAMPDVFSIRNTTVEAYAEPIVHEINVRRADLLSDLRKPGKRQAYAALSSQCWYVLKAGIGGPDDIPVEFGVLIADDAALEVARPAQKRPMRLSFNTWVSLAKANALPAVDDAQQGLSDAG